MCATGRGRHVGADAGLPCAAARLSRRVYSFNVRVLDPTWFTSANTDLEAKLHAQLTVKPNAKLQTASRAYLEFLRLGGDIRMSDLTRQLIRKYLSRSIPILAGLSATYLYHTARNEPTPVSPTTSAGYPWATSLYSAVTTATQRWCALPIRTCPIRLLHATTITKSMSTELFALSSWGS